MYILGHTFRPMTHSDYLGFAGAAPGSFIHEGTDGRTVLILSPPSQGESNTDKVNWTLNEVLDCDSDFPDLAITDAGEVERLWSFQVVR